MTIQRQLREKIEFQKNKLDSYKQNLMKLSRDYDESFSNELKKLEEHSKFINNPELQIAIVGAIKAGKSTLMNALLNAEIASTEVTPETATLTKFKYSQENYLKVTFYTKEEWNELWKSINAENSRNDVFKTDYDLLGADRYVREYIDREDVMKYTSNVNELREEVKKYSSSKSYVHYFVKEIEIGIDSPKISKEICYVDTPGLNDVVAYRSNITRDYIARANAVIVCINADSMRNDEYQTVVKVFENVGKNKEKVFILGTQLDKLNNPETDWEKQKKEWEKYLVAVFKDREIMRENILGVSSYIYHLVNKLCEKEKITDNQLTDLINYTKKTDWEILKKRKGILEKLKELVVEDEDILRRNSNRIKEKTNMDVLYTILNGRLLENSAKILAEDVEYRYSILKENLSIRIQEIIQNTQESINYLKLDLDALKLEKTKKEVEIDNLDKGIKGVNKEMKNLKSAISLILEEGKSRIDNELKKI